MSDRDACPPAQSCEFLLVSLYRGQVGGPMRPRALNTAALHEQADNLRQQVLDLRKALEERVEELAAAREANRRMMAELNHR